MSQVYAVCSGMVIPLHEVKDSVFSSGMVGDGVAIQMIENIIAAPADGTVTSIFPTGHAFSFITCDGNELLIHIGLETVNLKEKVFQVLVQKGAKVKKGMPIVEVNLEELRRGGYEPIVLMIRYEKQVKKKKLGKINVSECIFEAE